MDKAMEQETAERVLNQSTQPTDADGDSRRQGEPGQSDGSSKERSPWDKFLAQLRSVRLIRSAKKLRDLREKAKVWYPVLEREQKVIQEQLDAASDPLDKAAFKEELATATAKVGKLDNGLAAINRRAEALVGQSAA